jgi:phosphatidylserine/phosphatidylglycerophosphate/cardiolipin synthase-like enzyme
MADVFDIATRPIPGGYFLSNPPVGRSFANLLDLRYEHHGPERIVWTRDGESSTLKEALLQMIRGARRKIFIASFRIGDNELFEALFAAADRLRGSVYVITLVDPKSLAQGLAELDEGASADKQTLQKQFGPLVERGLYVRGHNSCHAKFVIVDDEIALISSANLETRAFTVTTEVGVVLRNEHEVGRMARFFARLWHECTLDVQPTIAYKVAERSKTQPPFRAIPKSSARQCAIWTHDDERYILDAMKEAIQNAKRELLLASFSSRDMSSNRDLLLSEVERFRKRTNGLVRLLLRAQNHVPSQRRDAEAFTALGCSVFADEVNHAKCVIADRTDAVLFSANFDAQHGLTSGVETGMRLVESRLVQRTYAFFDELIRAAPVRLVASPSHQQIQTLAARWISPWRGPATVPVVVSDAHWKALTGTGAKQPVLFEEDADRQVVVIAGRGRYLLHEGDAHGRRKLEFTGEETKDSSTVFEEWLLSKGKQYVVRGVCTGTFVRD